MEGEIGAADIVTQQAVGFGLLDGGYQPFDGQGVFVAHVDVTLAGADGDAGNQHALENTVGVAFQDATVHIGAGVAFVGVADDGALAVVLGAGGPFDAGGKAAAAASPQARGLDLVR